MLKDAAGVVTGWKCKTCAKIVQPNKDKKGLGNLKSHLNTRHPGWKVEYDKIKNDPQATFDTMGLLPSAEEASTFEWLSWVVEEALPFTFVESGRTHQNTALALISAKTLKARGVMVASYVKKDIQINLPEMFGLMFDGWSHGGLHYVAIFAITSLGKCHLY